MTDTELMGVSLFVIVTIGLIAWSIAVGGKRKRSRNEFIAKVGFVPCELEKNDIEAKITLLENNSEYTCTVGLPVKVSQGNIDVYFYTKSRVRKFSGGSNKGFSSCDEFLLPIKRKKNVPFQLHFKPSSIKEGRATNILRSMATGQWDAQFDDLVKIELPRELQKSNFLGVMGPKGCSFNDLFDSSAISLLTQAGDHDINTIQCRGDLCSIDQAIYGSKGSYEKIWSFIHLLISQGL